MTPTIITLENVQFNDRGKVGVFGVQNGIPEVPFIDKVEYPHGLFYEWSKSFIMCEFMYVGKLVFFIILPQPVCMYTPLYTPAHLS